MNDHDALIASYLDGSIDADSLAQLQDWIAASSENAQYYMRRAAIHDALRDASGARDEKSSGGHRVVGRIGFGAVALAAAVLLVAGGLALYVLTLDPEPSPVEPSAVPIATLIESTGGTLTTPNGYAAEGNEYAAGDYVLSGGRAHFLLTNLVTVNLRGDTRLRMHSPQNVSLTRGNAAFNVPKGVDGFTVHLPDRSQIIDLGTAFSVDVDELGRSRVHVTQGTVSWTTGGDTAESIYVAAGEYAMAVNGHVEVIADRDLKREVALDFLLADSGSITMPSLDTDEPVDTLGKPAPAIDRFGRADRAIYFDGDSAVRLDANWPESDYTASAWVHPDDQSTAGYVIGIQDSARGPGRFIRISSGLAQASHVVGPMRKDGSNITALRGPSVPTGKWTHVAAVYNADESDEPTLTLYVNGRPVATQPVAHAQREEDTGQRTPVIGARPDRPDQLGFIGRIDGAFVVGRAMSEDELLDLYELSAPPVTPEPKPAVTETEPAPSVENN